MRGWWLVLFGTVGCAAETDNDRIVIGFFGIEGTRTEVCAEAGLLAAPEKMVLTAHLQRFDRMLQWDDGTGLKVGEYVIESQSFEVEQSVFVDMRQDQQGDELLPCTIERRLVIAGTLSGDEAKGFSGFEGTWSYVYVPTSGSSCDDLLSGDVPIATALPCTVAFSIVGQAQ
jgi:hypothetical protein